jgi:hypothetical protein
MSDASSGVTPEEVVAAILVEFKSNIVPGYFVNYTHNIFRVYLDPVNFSALRPYQTRMREEATLALSQELKGINGPSGLQRGSRFLSKPRAAPKFKRHEALGEWIVDFFQNEDDDAEQQPLLVYSAGSTPLAAGSLQGTPTMKVERAPEPEPGGTLRARAQVRSPLHAAVYATLTYEDDSGGHTFNIVKELTKVGRGGPVNWVDVTLLTSRDVSREHCQIRRDGAGNQFFIKDLSKFGTWVDGTRVPPSIEIKNGIESDKGIEAPLPLKAQITLADIVSMQFRALRKK